MSPVSASVQQALSLGPAQSRQPGDIAEAARDAASPSSALGVTKGNPIDPPGQGGRIPPPRHCGSSCGGDGASGHDALSAIAALMRKFSEAQEMAR